jgi:hypothetical protein
VGFVYNQQIIPARVGRFTFGGQRLAEQPQRALTLQEINGRDEAREVGPRIDVQATAAAQVAHEFAVYNPKLQTELVAHLIAPLNLNGGRADDDDAADPVPKDQFLRDQARLNGFAEADIIGDQEVDPWHPQRPHDRIKLIFLDLNAAAKR